MSTALALIQPNDFDLMSKLATIAAKSGYTGKNPEQCLFIMLKGFELGISSMQALDGIQIIQGKATVSPQLMLALINRSGELEDQVIDGNTQKCTVMMKRKGRSPHTETFSMSDAQSMGLAGKDNWKKQPAVMLKWRAVAACARVVFPDVIQGMYTPEELGAEVAESDAGELVIIEPEKKQDAPTLPAAVPSNVDVVTGEIIEATHEESPAPEQKPATMHALEPDMAVYDLTVKANFDKVMFESRHIEPNGPHRKNMIELLLAGGYFAKCVTVEDCVKIIEARPDKQKAAS